MRRAAGDGVDAPRARRCLAKTRLRRASRGRLVCLAWAAVRDRQGIHGARPAVARSDFRFFPPLKSVSAYVLLRDHPDAFDIPPPSASSLAATVSISSPNILDTQHVCNAARLEYLQAMLPCQWRPLLWSRPWSRKILHPHGLRHPVLASFPLTVLKVSLSSSFNPHSCVFPSVHRPRLAILHSSPAFDPHVHV